MEHLFYFLEIVVYTFLSGTSALLSSFSAFENEKLRQKMRQNVWVE